MCVRYLFDPLSFHITTKLLHNHKWDESAESMESAYKAGRAQEKTYALKFGKILENYDNWSSASLESSRMHLPLSWHL